MSQNQCRTVDAGDDIGHGEGLARAGDAEERLIPIAGVEAVYQLINGLGLIAGGLIIGYQFESIHGLTSHAEQMFF